MAQIIIDIPDNIMLRVGNAFALRNNWNLETGTTKAQNAKKQIIEYIKRTIQEIESQEASLQVHIQKKVEVDGLVIV